MERAIRPYAKYLPKLSRHLRWLKKQGVVFEERVFQIYGSKHPRSHKPSLISGTSYIKNYLKPAFQRGVKIMTGFLLLGLYC